MEDGIEEKGNEEMRAKEQNGRIVDGMRENGRERDE